MPIYVNINTIKINNISFRSIHIDKIILFECHRFSTGALIVMQHWRSNAPYNSCFLQNSSTQRATDLILVEFCLFFFHLENQLPIFFGKINLARIKILNRDGEGDLAFRRRNFTRLILTILTSQTE